MGAKLAEMFVARHRPPGEPHIIVHHRKTLHKARALHSLIAVQLVNGHVNAGIAVATREHKERRAAEPQTERSADIPVVRNVRAPFFPFCIFVARD